MPAVDIHSESIPNAMLQPARNAAPVTPADGADLGFTTRWVSVSVAGNLVVDMVDNGTQTLPVPVGIFPIRCNRIRATGTTATGITAYW